MYADVIIISCLFVVEAARKTDILCAFFQHLRKVNPMPIMYIGIETRLLEKQIKELAPGFIRAPYHILVHGVGEVPKL